MKEQRNDELPPHGLSEEETKKWIFSKRGFIQKESTTDNLDANIPNIKQQQEEHAKYMHANGYPYYPYFESQETCKFCNKILKDAIVDPHLVGGFKLVIKDKNTGEIRASFMGPTIEGCQYCGRKLMISKDGIEFF